MLIGLFMGIFLAYLYKASLYGLALWTALAMWLIYRVLCQQIA